MERPIKVNLVRKSGVQICIPGWFKTLFPLCRLPDISHHLRRLDRGHHRSACHLQPSGDPHRGRDDPDGVASLSAGHKEAR